MSLTVLRIIPCDYSLLPPAAPKLDRAVQKLSGSYTEAASIEAKVFAEVTFIDQGEGFESVYCPCCDKELEIEWWQDAMNNAYENRFEHLDCTCPYCRQLVSLNELNYHSPAGFSRFAIEITDPQITEDLEGEELKELEGLLGCKLKQVWAHY